MHEACLETGELERRVPGAGSVDDGNSITREDAPCYEMCGDRIGPAVDRAVTACRDIAADPFGDEDASGSRTTHWSNRSRMSGSGLGRAARLCSTIDPSGQSSRSIGLEASLLSAGIRGSPVVRDRVYGLNNGTAAPASATG